MIRTALVLAALLALEALADPAGARYREPTTTPDGRPLTPSGPTLDQCAVRAGAVVSWIPATSPSGGGWIPLAPFLPCTLPTPVTVACVFVSGSLTFWGPPDRATAVATLTRP